MWPQPLFGGGADVNGWTWLGIAASWATPRQLIGNCSPTPGATPGQVLGTSWVRRKQQRPVLPLLARTRIIRRGGPCTRPFQRSHKVRQGGHEGRPCGSRHHSRAALFIRAPRFASRTARKLCLQTHKGRRSAERRIRRPRRRSKRSAANLGARLHCPIAARAAFGGRARLSALYRGSRRGFYPSAQSGPALPGIGTLAHPSPSAASSWRTRVRGPGEFPNRPRCSYEPHPGHRSRSHQTAVTG
jgi:hypothetical protein